MRRGCSKCVRKRSGSESQRHSAGRDGSVRTDYV